MARAVATGGARRVKAVVWDLDGTLLDFEPKSTAAIQRALEPCGATFTEDIKRDIIGMKAEDWSRITLERLGLTGRMEPEELARQWGVNLEAMYPDMELLPGADAVTAYFAGVPLPQAIATSSKASAVALKRKPHEDLFGRMSSITTGDEVEHGKPAPNIFLLAASRLGVDPADCLLFEDSHFGVAAGVAAGMQVVAVPDAAMNTDLFADADVVLSSLADFDPAVFGLPPRGTAAEASTNKK